MKRTGIILLVSFIVILGWTIFLLPVGADHQQQEEAAVAAAPNPAPAGTPAPDASPVVGMLFIFGTVAVVIFLAVFRWGHGSSRTKKQAE